MNFEFLLANIQWIPVILMTLFSFLLGFIWHSPLLFGKIWSDENYPDGLPEKMNAPKIFIFTGILHFMGLAALSAFISNTDGMRGAETGLIVSLFWIFPALASSYLFASRTFRLIFVDASMYIVLFVVSGYVFGAL